MVAGAATRDFDDACAGAEAAVAFFKEHGLQLGAPLVIDIAEVLPKEVGRDAAGCYLEQTGRICMLNYAEFRKFKTWFDIPISRDMYRSVASHETAHLIASRSFKIARPTIQAKEYLAYVGMLSTMSQDLRVQILKRAETDGVPHLERVTPLMYMFDPMRFGVLAYRHYASLEDGGAFIRAVLAGEALTD